LGEEVALDCWWQRGEPDRSTGGEGVLDQGRGLSRVGEGDVEDGARQNLEERGGGRGRVDLTLRDLRGGESDGEESNDNSGDLHVEFGRENVVSFENVGIKIIVMKRW